MKINTNNMTPIAKIATDAMNKYPDKCLYNANKNIPNVASALNNNDGNNKGESGSALGSWVRYVPTIFYTPVKTSARRPSNRGLDAQGVDDLNKAFASLLIGDPKEEEETKETEHHEEFVEGEQFFDDNDESSGEGLKLGRYKTKAKTHKSVRRMDVIRSYRLTNDEE